jgi:hypothetical protein
MHLSNVDKADLTIYYVLLGMCFRHLDLSPRVSNRPSVRADDILG